MYRLAACACLALLAGCATLTESTQQDVLVQTILDNHELPGVGCVLYNDVGKWFVTTPARVTIRKSAGALRIDCRKDGGDWAYEKVESKVNASLWGNVVLTAGAGYFVDRNTGAGFDYPSTLTVVMHKGDTGEGLPPPPAGVTVF
ncbi:MAG TPA: hypothetical protein VJ752_18145 [Burkholderiaceae bacterium]|nr:hypothetical protein [Burkholderiaceae bacterium]